MELTPIELTELAELGISAAVEAGQMVGTTRPADVEYKSDDGSLASQVVTEIDRASERIIIEILKPTLTGFDLALLTEETPDDGGRQVANYFWCIDPIDGTLQFIEGVPGYSVSIALVRGDGMPQIGVVHDPVADTTYHAIAGGGLWRDGREWSPTSLERSDSLSLFRNPSLLAGPNSDGLLSGLEQVASSLGLDGLVVHEPGGAVMNACGVLASPTACYFMVPKLTGGASLWDVAATACLFGEAGAMATDFAGGVLDLNRPDGTSIGHRGALFATDAALAARIREAVASVHTLPPPS